MGALMEHASASHNLELTDNGELIINSLDQASPFSRLELSRIHAIVPFERSVAIVLPNSILFLNKKDSGVNVHFKPNPTSLSTTEMAYNSRISHNKPTKNTSKAYTRDTAGEHAGKKQAKNCTYNQKLAS